MAKHNPKEPKFRCNFCKEYHYVPEYKTMYQCASHGYLCEKVIVTDESRVKLSSNEFEREVNYPLKYVKFCNLDGNEDFTTIRERIFTFDWDNSGLSVNSTDLDIIDFSWNKKIRFPKKNQPNTQGCRKTIKYNWSDELNLWIEEGNENLIINPTQTSKSPNHSSDIYLLLDLFEKNILSKDQFITQLKEKL